MDHERFAYQCKRQCDGDPKSDQAGYQMVQCTFAAISLDACIMQVFVAIGGSWTQYSEVALQRLQCGLE